MQLDGKVLLGRLYERTSLKGNRYFSGRLGAARIMLFKDDHADDDNVWQIFVQDGDAQAPQASQEGQGHEIKPLHTKKRSKRTSTPENATTDPPLPDDSLPDVMV